MSSLGGELRSKYTSLPAPGLRQTPSAARTPSGRASHGTRLGWLASAWLVVAGAPGTAQITVTDVAIETGLQDTYFNHFKRGRALVAVDFNLDSRIDFYFGNPNDESFVAIDTATEGLPQLEMAQLLEPDLIAWGAAAADYDNDGDYDLFIAAGGNECTSGDRLYRNLLIENGGEKLEFENVTEEAGIAGPTIPGTDIQVPMASANGVWADYDRDGDVDLFVNSNNQVACRELPDVLGRNVLWRNEGDGTFTNVTVEAGLADSIHATRHSSFLDFDNDGFYDLYENNYLGPNVLWHNQGDGTFKDATAEFSLPGDDLSFPGNSFVSCPGDFDNNGWTDLVVFARDEEDIFSDCSVGHEGGHRELPAPRPGARFETSPYALGHALFINDRGLGFGNRAIEAGMNSPYIGARGVMGSQIGDLNADGTLDLFIGNGGPIAGERDQLLLSDPRAQVPPSYVDASFLIDFEAPVDPAAPPGSYPDYPYRTHGSVMVDIDGDGVLELVVSNGGPSDDSGIPPQGLIAEPNRAFRFDWGPAREVRYLQVRLQGDGENVSRDAIGSRVEVVVSDAGSEPRSLHRTLFGGSCFSAQNAFAVYFGLGQAETVHEIHVDWVDGTRTTVTEDLGINRVVPIRYGA